MDLIGSINYIENRLGGRKPNQGRGKATQKNKRNDAAEERKLPTDPGALPTEYDTRVGRKIDTTA